MICLGIAGIEYYLQMVYRLFQEYVGVIGIAITFLKDNIRVILRNLMNHGHGHGSDTTPHRGEFLKILFRC